MSSKTIATTNQLGELPTTGGLRPGPIGFMPAKSAVRWYGARPVAIRIPVIQVDTDVQQAEIVDGVLQDPTGPWVVAWYEGTSRLGVAGNVVLAGHLDYWGTGPAVFYQLGTLVQDDKIEITGNNGEVFRYSVVSTTSYDNATAPIDEIVGPTTDEVATLITCGGTFDSTTEEYQQRTVVRAARSA
jgi:sortase (surface protein transpeptidase)